jgi:2-polyprenyl-6-methoxyphenol hydroxylase-like FAD-dependent oxidoreductase
MPKTILISGAGIAGPALAFWLARSHRYDVTIVESAPALRTGGHAVDFRGSAHMTVLQKMGLLEALQAHRIQMAPFTFVDRAGRTIVRLSEEFASGELEILRSDVSRILFDATKNDVRYIFNDSIQSLAQDPDAVDVTFKNAPPARFDLVVGADGMHSNVRRQIFGDEDQLLRHTGYYLALAPIAARWNTYVGQRFNIPGKSAGVHGAAADPHPVASFFFASDDPSLGRLDQATQRQHLQQTFANMDWIVPDLLSEAAHSPDFYMDSITVAKLKTIHSGRVVLIGDAAYGGTLGGMGTGLAVVAAYVLAGELARAHDDHHSAFPRYEELMSPYARTCQKTAESAGPFLAPKTPLGLRARNLLLKLNYALPGRGLMESLAHSRASDVSLPIYAHNI